jgi:transcriptional regulator with XRE-family HTH domain
MTKQETEYRQGQIAKKVEEWMENRCGSSANTSKYCREVVKANIEYILKKTGLTGALLAEIIGEDPKNFSKIKNNGGPLDADHISRLNYILGIDITWLYTGDEAIPWKMEHHVDNKIMDATIKCRDFVMAYKSLPDLESQKEIMDYFYKAMAPDSDPTDFKDSKL